MPKNKLSVSYDFNFILFGVNANVKPHKLAWYLNRHEGLDFFKDKDIELEFSQSKTIYITRFTHQDEYAKYLILKNKTDDVSATGQVDFLLPELKQFDYLVLLENESSTFNENVFFEKIRRIPFVQFAIKVDLKTIKSRDNLIF